MCAGGAYRQPQNGILRIGCAIRARNKIILKNSGLLHGIHIHVLFGKKIPQSFSLASSQALTSL